MVFIWFAKRQGGLLLFPLVKVHGALDALKSCKIEFYANHFNRICTEYRFDLKTLIETFIYIDFVVPPGFNPL